MSTLYEGAYRVNYLQDFWLILSSESGESEVDLATADAAFYRELKTMGLTSTQVETTFDQWKVLMNPDNERGFVTERQLTHEERINLFSIMGRMVGLYKNRKRRMN